MFAAAVRQDGRMAEIVERRTVTGELIERVERPDAAASLGLDPHPEGGWYRRTWTGRAAVSTPTGERPAATMILFLLPAGEASAWHLVANDEVWIWSGMGEIALQDGGSGERPEPGEITVLGDAATGAAPQAIVAGGRWQRTLPAAHDALASCMVSPGFDFADFAMAEDAG